MYFYIAMLYLNRLISGALGFCLLCIHYTYLYSVSALYRILGMQLIMLET